MNDAALDIGQDNPAEKPIFSALLVPHRSLGRFGYFMLLGLFVILCGSTAIFYQRLGAWPVVWFMLADVAIFWLAFQLNFRAGRIREEVELTRTALTVRKTMPSGKRREHTYNPFWAKFDVKRDDARGIIDMRIIGEGYQSTLGAFLNPDDKESFATAFGQALATAKR